MVRVIDYHPTGAAWERLGSMRLPAEPESVPEARRWFRRLAERLPFTRPMDDCLVMLSELVTNAIAYGKADGDWTVRVDWWRDGRSLHVAVHNPGDCEAVHPHHSTEDDEHGRGLYLVQCLADSWQAGPSPLGGTQVSFVLERALEATDAPGP